MAILSGIVDLDFKKQFRDFIFAETEGYERAWTAKHKPTQPEWTKGIVPQWRMERVNDFTWIMRTWSEVLTHAERLRWSLANLAFHNRMRYPAERPPHKRWLNVQMPLRRAGREMTYPESKVAPYIIERAVFDKADSSTQRLHAFVEYTRQIAEPADMEHYTVWHVHQVPRIKVHRYVAAAYARYVESMPLDNPDPWPERRRSWILFDSQYPFAKGDKMQLYFRITYYENPIDPPESPRHRTQTWDWTELVKVAV